jgi:hypothetical protein
MTEQSLEAAATRGRLLSGVTWIWVAAPFSYGLYELLVKIPALFTA